MYFCRLISYLLFNLNLYWTTYKFFQSLLISYINMSCIYGRHSLPSCKLLRKRFWKISKKCLQVLRIVRKYRYFYKFSTLRWFNYLQIFPLSKLSPRLLGFLFLGARPVWLDLAQFTPHHHFYHYLKPENWCHVYYYGITVTPGLILPFNYFSLVEYIIH